MPTASLIVLNILLADSHPVNPRHVFHDPVHRDFHFLKLQSGQDRPIDYLISDKPNGLDNPADTDSDKWV